MDEHNASDKGRERIISEKELHHKLDTFEQLAEEPKDKFAVMRFRNNYLDAKERVASKNGIQREHFLQGVDKGIHKDDDIKNLDNNIRLEDQQQKKDSLKEAKDYYHTNYSLTIKFSEKTLSKEKNKQMDKE